MRRRQRQGHAICSSQTATHSWLYKVRSAVHHLIDWAPNVMPRAATWARVAGARGWRPATAAHPLTPAHLPASLFAPRASLSLPPPPVSLRWGRWRAGKLGEGGGDGRGAVLGA